MRVEMKIQIFYLQNLGVRNFGPQPSLRKIADFSRINYSIGNA
jgi:hypothetical protein